jgi:hypothetical protein
MAYYETSHFLLLCSSAFFLFSMVWATLAGRYQLHAGWYDSHQLFAAETDARSRLGELVVVGILEIP